MDIIALRVIRHSDRHSILRALSREDGVVALLVPATASREARRIRALVTPLSAVSCETRRPSGSEILTMRDVRPLHTFHNIPVNPLRAALAIFTADFINSFMRDGQPDPLIFDFILQAAEILNLKPVPRLMNFHICFLRHMAALAGIEPDFSTWRPGSVFDMRDGVFRLTPPLHNIWLPEDKALTAAKIGSMTWNNMHCYRLSKEDRNEILDEIIRYFTLHFTRLTIPSLDILRAMSS